MKKYFEPDRVMQSLRKMAGLLEEATKTDTTLADAFLQTIKAVKTERRRSFSRQQLWELEQMESQLQQKLVRSETSKHGPSSGTEESLP